MANFKQWTDALNGQKSGRYNYRPTIEVYDEIDRMGLETVDRMGFRFDSSDASDRIAPLVRGFVKEGKPCLFIWDPMAPDLRKGYITDVVSCEQVEGWLLQQARFREFSYMLTSQITNPGDGFVGSVISAGEGRMVLETYHRPGVYVQRELSQPKGDITKHLQCSVFDEFRFRATDAGFLERSDAMEFVKVYGLRKGYFEFVKGKIGKREAIFTIGYEPLDAIPFPNEIHEQFLRDAGKRALASKPF